ncbi:hypothetical protein ASO20_02040 [Mycoplasma sp. (ex Biomphalaria glabrata)]|uniref:pyruvate:ferredoxin (flavodoxin) oxidoreductase n=1 Tax=Mycoplasma sp. (ex Biomphalaria glabrata) TaxID=1749074 RepID=UPI00073A561C|nr:pyruvate:ferredoxin (flavodoxin) oxidoreductase [Mycoplasma sp. (ex Biomphalaria glabrata)]ALV23424.1 hypothetical protein ASO20_02040 [Mycoplasma sp. (ex Biomphalaria glabrata)]
MKKIIINGTTAAALTAYQFSEVCAIYPISPSSSISEYMDIYSAKKKANVLGNVVDIIQMQSEVGAIAAVHGALQTGVLSSTFTSSQGLLLMLPNLYKLRGEMLPSVIYVASRSIASRSLSIFCDHQDIYATRITGVPIVSAASVQEILDLAPAIHASSLQASSPFIFFFDGFRTGHETQKVEEYTQEMYNQFLNNDDLTKFRNRTMTPMDPDTRGTSEDESSFFQSIESQNFQNQLIIDSVKEQFKKVEKLTGRHYAPFVYNGAKNPKYVMIIMGSATEIAEETINNLNEKNDEYGVIKVHLYRPFSVKDFVNVLPKSVQKIVVLDRAKEWGANGEPLYLDTVATINENKDQFKKLDLIIGGRYGLSSKDFNPAMVKSCFDHLQSNNPFHSFTVGINDDMNMTSIKIDDSYIIEKSDEKSYLFWGLAGDGMVSAGNTITNFIGENSKDNVQVYVTYDSRKAGGITRSFLRVSPKQIKAPYYSQANNLILCSKDSFVLSIRSMLSTLGKNGIFLLNTQRTSQEIVEILPNRMKKQLADKNAKFYIIDAMKLSKEAGLGERMNTVIQMAFLYLISDEKKFNESKQTLKDIVEKTYGKKGQDIVEANFKAMDLVSKENLLEINVDPHWKKLLINEKPIDKNISYEEFTRLMNNMDGNDIPVSFFASEIKGKSLLDGKALNQDITFNLKRQMANNIPVWNPENCIQCSQCAFYCPHATIRAFQLTNEEIKNAPKSFPTIEQTNPANQKYRFAIHIDAENCVGCGLCSNICPGKGPDKKALKMTPAKEVAFKNVDLTNYLFKKVEYKTDGYSTDTIKGAALLYPYFEASGACAGCGETPYYRLLTQLFGKDMVIANATGCTSIYSGTYPFTPLTRDKDGLGPTWANSLFEDNAEFGFGMVSASSYKNNVLRETIIKNLDKAEPEFKEILQQYLIAQSREEQRNLRSQLLTWTKKTKVTELKLIDNFKDVLVKKSHWIIGGDGWSYDIGYSGIDHVVASGKDINILILDTEVYSNTGGQKSKSSQIASVEKFAFNGKDVVKKDIALILMQYKNVYIAKISLGMNPMQAIKALKEAESYDGPSVVICYCPCVEHGIKGGMFNQRLHSMQAVMTGYWQIYRHDPRLIDKNQNPFQLDFKNPNFENLQTFLMSENRFAILQKNNPSHAQELYTKLRASLEDKFKQVKFLSENYYGK